MPTRCRRDAEERRDELVAHPIACRDAGLERALGELLGIDAGVGREVAEHADDVPPQQVAARVASSGAPRLEQRAVVVSSSAIASTAYPRPARAGGGHIGYAAAGA
jgi:hypothetical protein